MMQRKLSRRLALATHRSIFLLLLAVTIATLAGCGGSTDNVQNPPPPAQSSVTIAFTPTPGASLGVSFSENLTATVGNDPKNYGVDWNLTCQFPPNCGSLTVNGNTASHTASGSPITYTAPSSLAGNTMVVEITALATADPTKNKVAPITISTFNSSLPAGNYVLQAQGADSSLNPYQFAGVIQLDGKGGIKGGEQTANYASTGSLTDAIIGGNYFLGNDGRGTITINTNDTSIGGNGVETFAFVYLSTTQAMISQMDLGNAATGASATGTLDLQTTTAVPAGGYAFAVSGTDVVKALPVAFGGILNIDSPNTISGSGSVTDEIVGKKLNATALGISGTLTAPDQYGGFTLNLSAPFGAGNKSTPLQFTGYIVDSTHIKLIETDTINGSASPFGLTAGPAIGQGTATGTFTDNSFLSGTYVFGILGTDLSNFNLVPNTLTAVGLFTADGAGNLTAGFSDTFLDLNTLQGNSNPGAQISAPFTGTYSVDSTGTGRATSTSITFNPEPHSGYLPTLFLYLTGNGNPALALEAGDNHYPSVGSGISYPQSTMTAAFSGNYGFSFTQEISGGNENDGTAPLNADSTAMPPSLSGIADINLGFGANQDQPFTGTFTAPTATGPYSGVLVGTNNQFVNSVAFNPQIAVDYYFIDPEHGFWVETDLLNAAPPEQPGQVSIGYYAARTPVCTGCP
jgi:hypothetical protein